VEDKKVVPVREVCGWKHNEIPKIPIYKSERIEFKMNGTQTQLKKNSNKEEESHDKSKICRKWEEFHWKIFQRPKL
jgi:hypothetical protein